MSKREAKKQAKGIYFDIGQIIPIRAGDGEASGVSFAHFQANRQAAPAMRPMLDDHLPILLEQFRQAYVAYGRQSFVVGALEKGAVFQPSEWLPLACAVRDGGVVLLGKNDRKPVAFMFFFVLGFPAEPCTEAITEFLRLAAEAGARLGHEERAALGVVRETCAEAAWLTFVMSQLLGSPFIGERKDATLLINPFAACVKVLEDVARARQDAKAAEAGQSEAEDVVTLREIAAAFQEFQCLAKEICTIKQDNPERPKQIERVITAAVFALDLASRNLRLLNNCRLSYGCTPETRDLLFAIEGFASLTTTERMRYADEFVQGFKSYSFLQLYPNTEWAHEIKRWASEIKRAVAAQGRAERDLAAHAADDTRRAAAVVGGTWKRLRIAFVLVSLIVPVLLVGSGAWYWGEGDNLWQKCLKSWPFFAPLPGFWAIALRVILGRAFWQHFKIWEGDA